MNKFLLTILVLTTHQLSAQQLLIPYRKGDLYGLADAKGKMVMSPGYDYISWMQGGWFRTSKNAELKDTLETKPGHFFRRDTRAKLTGLINDGKVVLADEPFDDYEIVAKKCIVARADRRAEDLTKAQFKKYGDKRRFYSLFNLAGKNVYPDNFKRIQKIDTAGTSAKWKGQGRDILFITVDFQDRKSLFVYDADRQEISDWLIKDAYKLQNNPAGSNQDKKRIEFTTTSSNYDQLTQVVDYSTGKFVIRTLPPVANEPKSYGNGSGNGVGYGTGEGRVYQDVIDVAPDGIYDGVKEPGNMSPDRKKPAYQRYYIFVKDSLFYMTGPNERQPLALPANTKVLLREPRGMTQYSTVVARHDRHFYIIDNGMLGKVAYDSLIYFGEYFLAWQQVNGKQKAGVIKSDGTPYIPLQYDSLYAGIRYFDFEDKNPAGKSNYQPVLKEADSRYSYDKKNPYTRSFTDRLTVFANGKTGVISMKGDTIIPIEYQLVAQNNLNHMRPREDDFILLKKDNRYGLTKIIYNREKQKSEPGGYSLAPRYRYIPGFFYPNYFGVKKYSLVGLYDEHYKFLGYADENGKEFFED